MSIQPLTHRRHCKKCNAPFATQEEGRFICIGCEARMMVQGRTESDPAGKSPHEPGARALRKYVTAMAICREGDSPNYGETALSIRVEDEAAGWFYVIHQERDGAEAEIHVELDELRALLACAEEMAKQEPKE